MNIPSPLIAALVFALTVLCAHAQSNQRERSLLEATPVDNSWTNQLIVTNFDTFPIAGKLKPDIGIATNDIMNLPSFKLFEDGMVHLGFDFTPKGRPSGIGLFSLSFHIGQSRAIADKFEMFKSYSWRLTDAEVHPASLTLGEVHPDRSSPDKGRHFRFTIHVSQKAEPKLLIEVGDTPIVTGGEPNKFDLNVLSERDAQQVLKLLRCLPNSTWWKQREKGIISSPPGK